jgi:hypothetical protein
MKKAIKRYWGIGLILIILASLVATPATVSADDNEWVSQASPSGSTFVIKSGANVSDIAVFGNGSTVYTLAGDNFTYKSTTGGATWAKTQSAAMSDITPTMIAVAPDNVDRIAIADPATGMIKVSVNGGVTFSTISPIVTATSNMTTGIKCLTISATRNGANYVTVSGTDDANVGKVFYYNLGAVVGQQWTALTPAGGFEFAPAVAYSPNFVSDLTMEAVTANTTGDIVQLQVYSFASSSWNSADYPSYPVTVVSPALGNIAFASVTKASLALDPGYMGGEDSLRNTFIGLYTDTYGGIYRVLNTSAKNLASGNIWSVAYDGTTLVAGQANSSSVLRSLDPMAGTPTVTGSSAYKSPGGVSGAGINVVVAFVGSNVAAGTSGANSAFALSRSSGAYFNDVSMVDTALTAAKDVAVSSDSSKVYWVTTDNTYVSIWLKTTAWERILTFADTLPYVIRLSPTNSNVLYVGAVGGTRVYFSKDVQSRWYARTATDGGGTFTVKDLAVESDTVAYALNSTGSIIKSVNEGFIWTTTPISTKLTTGYSLVSVKENVLLAGSTGGKVAYSLDGGTTWTSISPATETGAANVILIPDEGFATNNIIYAATNTINTNVMKWVIGTSTAWEDAYSGSSTTVGATYGVYGLAMKGGILYALAVDTTANISSLRQYIPSVKKWATKDAASYITSASVVEPVRLAVDAASPNGLYASTGSNKLWAVQANAGLTQLVYCFTDTLATTPPALTGPTDKISVTSSSGVGDVVIITWNRAANATAHTVQVSYDSAFTQTILDTAYTYPTLNTIIGGTTSGTPLSPGKTYYWRVRASSPINSAYSEVRTFTVQALAAQVPVIASPDNGATILNQSPAFSWSPVTGTTKYEFQLSTTPTFGTTVLTDTPASAGTLVPVTIKLDQGKQYFWRVRALEPVQGDWSTAANFLVAVPTTTAAAVTVTVVPAPVITIPAAPAAATYTIAAPAVNQIAPTYIWAIIIIGAILVIAVIVLIVRTRRSV